MKRVAFNSVVVTVLNATVHAANFAVFIGIAALFGANWQTDSFFLAFSIPTFFVGAAVSSISSVFIPVITECRIHRPQALGRLVGSALVYVCLSSVLLALVVGLLAPTVIKVSSATTTRPEFQALAVRQVLLMLPVIVIQTLTGILAAAYNSAGKFWLPPATDAVGTVVALIVIAVLKPFVGVASLSVGFVAGAILHVLCLSLFWRQLGIKLELNWQIEPALAKSFWLTLPMLVAMAALYLIALVSRFFAASLAEGSVSVLDYASRISSGIMEFLTSGILLVVLADWSQDAAQGDAGRLIGKLRQTLRLILFGVAPAVAVLIALREPVIGVALERGQFNASLTERTASVLLFYLVGIPLDAVLRTYVRLFLAWRDTLVLGLVAILRLLSLTAFSMILKQIAGVEGLVLADLLGLTVMMAGLIFIANKRLGSTFSGLGAALLKLGISASVTLAVASLVNYAMADLSVWLRLSCAGLMGLSAYLTAAWVLRIQELQMLFELIPLKSVGGLTK